MNTNKSSFPLQVSLHGMNPKAKSMMTKYIALFCKNIATVVDETESQVEIIDYDSIKSKTILEHKLAKQPGKKIIVLSVFELSLDDVINIKKPINTENIVQVLTNLRKELNNKIPFQSVENTEDDSPKDIQDPDTFSEPLKFKQTTKPAKPSKNTSKNPKLGTENNVVEYPSPQKKIKSNLSICLQDNDLSLDDVGLLYTGNLPDNLEGEMSDSSIEELKLLKYQEEVAYFLSELNEELATENNEEIARLLNQLNQDDFESDNSQASEKFDNRRKAVRYKVDSIVSKLEKKSFIGSSQYDIYILDINSRGAYIELKKPSKLNGMAVLALQFDAEHTFTIPANIVRNVDNTYFGLRFVSYQHKLMDYLLNNDKIIEIVS